MDFVTGLNVTIYGLGIVFLALLVVMFAIMVLSRLFAVVTGKDFMAAPAASEEEPPEVPSPSVKLTTEVAKAVPASSSTPARPIPARVAPAIATSPAPAPSAHAVQKPVAGGGKVTAPLPGKVLSIAVKAGDSVRKGEELCVIEAMKMANSIKAQRDCTVQEVLVSAGDSVPFGAPLFVIE